MAATQRRTLALSQPLHIKQEALTLRSLTHSPQQQNALAASTKSETMQSIDLESRLLKHTAPSSNGFHSDVPAAPAAASSSFLGAKSAKLQQFLEESSSPESKRTVDMLLSQMHLLSAQEKMLLYLKLPGAKNGAVGQPQVDPLRQPINPLGTRHEIQQTITWIKTHLTEDPDVSLPKQDVYDEYMAYCETNSMKHLSTADFGKVMKQVFPSVRPRRLGTRGNSRYCYAGLCKRMRLERPMLPDLGCDVDSPISDKGDSNLEAAASYLVREWARKTLGEPFSNLRELASNLIDRMYVDGRSVAAFALLSATSEVREEQQDSPSMMLAAKERDAQFERKFLDKEQATAKRKGSQDSEVMEPAATASRPASSCKRQRLKNGRSSVESPVRAKKRPSPSASSSSVSPALTTPAATKMPIPRLSGATPSASNSRSTTPKLILISPSKQQLQQQPTQLQPQQPAPQQQQQNKKYKRIQPKPEPPMDAGEEANFFTDPAATELMHDSLGIPNLEQTFDDFLNGGNSQELEDHELMTYFPNTNTPVTVTNPEPPAQTVINEEPAKISHLRRLLEGNERTKESTKRRVSFENPAMDTVPASPNTRRRIFNFLPISPDDALPGGMLQAPPPSPASTAASASPFVSPANTPVPRMRNNSGQQFIYPNTRTRHSSAGPKHQALPRNRNFSGPAPANFEPTPHSPMLAPPDGRQRHVSAGQALQLTDLLGQEVSDLLSDAVLPAMPQFRSQSVPLHQMVAASSASSVAPTPVPSEFADFDEAFQIDHILLDDESDLLSSARVPTFNSRSYPNTPVPDLGGPTLLPPLLVEPSSRSYPSTPVVGHAPDPVISQLTLNAINQPAFGAARRNLTDLIDQSSSFSTDEHAVFHTIFTPAPGLDAFHDFDHSELTQLVHDVEGSNLLEEESLS